MLEINKLDRIYVGIEGENAARTIIIDISAWLVGYPNGSVSLWHRRHGDQALAATGAYMDEEEGQLIWKPSNTDTFYPGYGEAQIRLTENSVIKKTVNVPTYVSEADVGSDGNTIPSTWAGYINEVERLKGIAVSAKNDAEDAAEDAEEAQEAAEEAQEAAEAARDSAEYAAQHYPYVDEETGNWMVWDAEEAEWVDTGVHAQGETGPADTVSSYKTEWQVSSSGTTVPTGSWSQTVPAINKGEYLWAKATITYISGSAAISYMVTYQGQDGQVYSVDGMTGAVIIPKESTPTENSTKLLTSGGAYTALDAKLDKENVYNGTDKSSAGFALDARQGKSLNLNIDNLRKGVGYRATYSSGEWKLLSGENAAIGEFISVNNIMGVATAAITGGSTAIVEGTNWTALSKGALNVLQANKADKVASATSGHFAGLDASGNLTDSGKSNGDYVASNQGALNSGKALGIDSDGYVIPVPFSGDDFTGATAGSDGVHGYVPAPLTGEQGKFLKGDGTWDNVPNPQAMTGATSSAAGASGLVPAPAAGDNVKYLCGDGTWSIPPGAKLITRDLDTVTNVSGSYTHTTTISDVTADMKVVMLELGDPSAFLDTISVTTADGSITLSCNSVEGTSTVKVSMMFIAGAGMLTSSEFDVLAARIGTLSSLTTTEKTNLVGAVNELDSEIGTLSDQIVTQAVTITPVQNATIQAGGVYRIGRLIVVQLRFQISGSISTIYIATGFPAPLNSSGTNVVSMTNNKKMDLGITYNGYLQSAESYSSGTLIVSGCYVAET